MNKGQKFFLFFLSMIFSVFFVSVYFSQGPAKEEKVKEVKYREDENKGRGKDEPIQAGKEKKENDDKNGGDEKEAEEQNQPKDIECQEVAEIGLKVCRPKGNKQWRFVDITWGTSQAGAIAAQLLHYELKTKKVGPGENDVQQEIEERPNVILNISAIPNEVISQHLKSKDYISKIGEILGLESKNKDEKEKEEEKKIPIADKNWFRNLKNKKNLTFNDYMEIMVMLHKYKQFEPQKIKVAEQLQKRFKKIAKEGRYIYSTSFFGMIKGSTKTEKATIMFLQDEKKFDFTFIFNVFTDILTDKKKQAELEKEVDYILGNMELTKPKKSEKDNKVAQKTGDDTQKAIDTTDANEECKEIKKAGLKVCKPKGSIAWQFQMASWSPSLENSTVLLLLYSSKLANPSQAQTKEGDKQISPDAIITIKALPNALINTFLYNKDYRVVDICKPRENLTPQEKEWIDNLLEAETLNVRDFAELSFKEIQYCEFGNPERIRPLRGPGGGTEKIAKKSRSTYEVYFQGTITHLKKEGSMRIIFLPESWMTYIFAIFNVALTENEKKALDKDINYILENMEFFRPVEKEK